MSDKGNTYYCAWRQERDETYTGWEIRRPKLLANAATPADLQNDLADIVGEHYNDFEAAIVWGPRYSKAVRQNGLLRLGRDWMECQLPLPPDRHDGVARGRCSKCVAVLATEPTSRSK